ncbi:phage holin family protein [Serinicoccus kebangsaanensis]|uniref:phage holin family protein n=1 Tax=Serinicoccus kebangsaanensis TaxID=2602069 RepID=UPI00124CAF5E|nr:phage holin family protein [Serinicoccus kebangsaanensis]
MKILAGIVANGVALWVASALISGIEFGGQGWAMVLTIIGVAVVFGLVNAIVRPLAQLLSLPLIILTLGLFLLVVNALMLLLTSWLSGVLGLDFRVDDFWWDAVLGSIIISVVSMFVGMLLPDGRE